MGDAETNDFVAESGIFVVGSASRLVPWVAARKLFLIVWSQK